MDKETLSHYGWVVIAVMILAIIIALATPFGKYIIDTTEATVNNLVDFSDHVGYENEKNEMDDLFEVDNIHVG